jgi:mono/diheme cytochrome c family protein
MTVPSSPDVYPAFRSRRERIALGLVLLVVLGLPLAAIAYQRLQAAGPARVVDLAARLPTEEQGGWTPEIITVQKGERVRLRITSEDVVHGFSIPKLDVNVDWIEPGKVEEVEFVAHDPGRYTFQCTVWCDIGHWRMRGVLEVVDPDDPLASARDVDPPQTDWMASGLDIDADHPGQFVPETRPSAANGARAWAQASSRSLAAVAASLPLRELAPSDIYAYLSSQSVESVDHGAHDNVAPSTPAPPPLPGLPEAAALAELTPSVRWDIVAALYTASLPESTLTVGAELFERDCIGCHGLNGQGDGPGATAIRQQNAAQPSAMHGMADKPPADFTDLAAQAGAPDLLYYGKLVRGGMGTSMPYWGTIYSEDELWAVIAFIRSFAFQLE